jgi:hypothetical protein
VYPEPEGDRRHREETSTSTPRWLPTDLENGNYTGTKSRLQKFSQFDVSTSDSDSSRGSLLAGVGKEGEGMGKESSRNAPDNDDHFRPTSPIPNLASRNLAVCPYDK